MRSRFLMELTTPEVEGYLSRGGQNAFLPVGCVEMHGPHQPIGTDTLIAKAFSLRLAEQTDGLVLPEIHYTWAGSTDGFAGTVSIESDLVQKTVESIAIKVFRMGLRRLLVLNVHHGNHYPLFLSVRQVYEKHHIPAVYINAYEPLGDEIGKIFSGKYEQSKEASLVLASLKILGKESLYSEEEMSRAEQPPAMFDSYENISKAGTVGYFMQDPRHHACPSKYVSMEKGIEFIEAQVKLMIPVLDHLETYLKDTNEQTNKGWWR